MSWKDIAEEVAQHLRDQYAELRARGLSHEDAMRANAAEIAHLNPGDWSREVQHAGRSLWRARGFSLPEVVIGLGIGSIVMLGVISTFLMMGRSGANIANYTRMDAQMRRALEEFAQDIRMASNFTWNSSTSVTAARSQHSASSR